MAGTINDILINCTETLTTTAKCDSDGASNAAFVIVGDNDQIQVRSVKQNSVDNYHVSEASSSKNITAQALKMVQPTTALKPSSMSYSPNDLLSPPDVSLTSISPGEETDATVTVEESTPSSANITPSLSGDLLIETFAPPADLMIADTI